ncbi:MAG TPA: beta-glucosidase BglX [Pyrinomonadaceae bacterium]|nr:beta-glucosidase BglX [Pyrinomonadaceae bacterium]
MKNIRSVRIARFLLSIAVILTIVAAPFNSVFAQKIRIKKESMPTKSGDARQRANALLVQMTLEEKIGQMNQLFFFGQFQKPDSMFEGIRKGQIGSLLFVTDPAQINQFQKIAVTESRLKIPLIFGFDVIHGFRTIFPVPLATAASWDPKTAERNQTIAAREARSVGINWTFAPMVDIARDPRWGRIVEGAGEDPFLGSVMSAAQVRGFQGEKIGMPERILACAKHFAGYGAAEGGRDYDASYIPESQMQNVYLPPFKAAVEAGVGSLMSAYMDLNDVPATGNKWLLQDVLRKDWNFQGFVVSDADAVKNLLAHGYARDPQDAAVKALNAGINLEMSLEAQTYVKNLGDAVKKKLVTEKQIDAMVLPLLEAKYKLGLFENPYVDQTKVDAILGDPNHRDAAQSAAESAAVLLKNQNNILPLDKNSNQKLAVIGPLADSKRDTLGSWVFQQNTDETVTILEGIKSKLGTKARVEYTEGVQIRRKFPSFFDALFGSKRPDLWTPEQAEDEIKKAVKLAKNSDVSVLVLGESQDMSGEAASRSSLELPGRQQELLEAVTATGKPVVLILMNGRPLDITWAAQNNVSSILEIWYPGTRGGTAAANLLFGDANPGGKLPVTWMRNAGQIPIYYSHNTTQDPSLQGKRYWNEESVPLYPFGYGLSYTTFAISNMKMNKTQIKPGDTVEVSVDVKNTGNRTGDEVVQLYIHQQAGSASRPVRELKGFERVTLAPGETKTIRFALGKKELQYWSAATKSWVQEAETFDVWVGNDSNAANHSTFKVVP